MSQIKERPILFSAPMVRAVLDGRKTVTRRPVKVQPRSRADIGSYGKGQPFIRNPDVTKRNPECPFGNPGDRLWVRETWYCDHNEVMRGPYLKPDDLDVIEARDDGTLVYAADGLTPYEADQPVWKPSIHMPRWASRILLEITDVRVERLQDISRADIRAEGLQCPPELASDDVSPNYRDWYPEAWKELWNSTGGDWDANPWVWVVEFKRVTP
ncbi:hypothetical protein [Pseudomonas siliginis]|uniref:hypothetical protein n=1 Tax=Pseudomonas siliginis TaxID=2842346 RepID=UPI00209215C8|nr:hypothetical protein [Pseudomonas siliginis]UST97724.1 hypothetical protein NF679_11670 [Pseudomonas siliginis]